MRRAPPQLDGGGAGIVRGSDGGLATGNLPEGQHVVRLLAVPGVAHAVDGGDPEAVGGEGLEVVHLEDRGVAGSLQQSRPGGGRGGGGGREVAAALAAVPPAVLPHPDLD